MLWIRCDCWIARRKRVHFTMNDKAEVIRTDRDLDEALAAALNGLPPRLILKGETHAFEVEIIRKIPEDDIPPWMP